MKPLRAIALIVLVLTCFVSTDANETDASPWWSPAASAFLEELAKNTWAYLSSDWATDNHLPWSWRSASLAGGDYANPAEIGLYMLSYMGAYEMRQAWSPSLAVVQSELTAVLNQLRAWQTNSQPSQPHGPNAYTENGKSVFYQWYWIGWNPPVVGAPAGTNHVVPSVDNAWLAASLMTIREWDKAHGTTSITQMVSDILSDMDFLLWYDSSQHLFYWGDVEMPGGGALAGYYSDENRIINFVARALGHLSDAEYQASLDALNQFPATYDRGTPDLSDDITVGKVAGDGSIFTYLSPALFIREMETAYGTQTIRPAIEAQIAYAQDRGYAAWGLSDCYDIGTGGYIQQGALPTAWANPAETHFGVVTPHASGMALITPLADAAVTNLQSLSTILPAVYDSVYGFKESVMALPGDPAYGQASVRFSALAQEWLFLALANAQTGFIWDYFYRDANVVAAHHLMFQDNLRPALRLNSPANGSTAAALQPTFSWFSFPGVVRYEFQLDSLTPIAAAALNTSGASYTPSDPILPLSYYWRVRGVDTTGRWTFWSPIWYIRVVSPSSAAPKRNYVSVRTPTLAWNRVLQATDYEIQVASTGTFQPLAYTIIVPAATLTLVPLPLPDGVYYWRVRARTNGSWQKWSAFDTFVVDVP